VDRIACRLAQHAEWLDGRTLVFRKTNPYASRAVMLAAAAARIRNGCDLSRRIVSAGKPLSGASIRFHGATIGEFSFVGPEACLLFTENSIAADRQANSRLCVTPRRIKTRY